MSGFTGSIERAAAIARLERAPVLVRCLAVVSILMQRWQDNLHRAQVEDQTPRPSINVAASMFDSELVVAAAGEAIRRSRRWRLEQRIRRQHVESEAD